MTDAPVDIIEREVRELVRRAGVDPARDEPAAVARLVDRVLGDYEERVERSPLPLVGDRSALRKAVLDRVAGYGPLQPLMDDPTVEEIWINGPGRVFCARAGQHVLTNIALTDGDIRDLVERMLRTSGRRLDLSSPFVDAMLLDGSRLHVVIPDITRKHWSVNIRKFVLRANRLEELVRLGSLNERGARFLAAAVKAGVNIVVSGGTQTGKTTLLNCLAAEIPSGERVLTCEEVFELQIQLPDVVSMQTRQANLEGKGEIDLRRLIVEALRMRPDRIIVGEVRQREALDLLVALNSGLPGMTSIHANSAHEAVTKLTTLPLLAGENVTHAFVLPTVAACVDLVVHLRRERGHRSVVQILGLTGRVEGDRVETVSLFERIDGSFVWTGHEPPRRDRFEAAGLDLRRIPR
ncbi:MAG TPA: ATPase, T2SS/T4P/T4SS family [Actinomycetota bacterium]|nr:ATPase, T2SS/T4P/T4SS family [Actinomycetota bacterium]